MNKKTETLSLALAVRCELASAARYFNVRFAPKIIYTTYLYIYTNRSRVKFSGSEIVETVNHTSQCQTQLTQLQR